MRLLGGYGAELTTEVWTEVQEVAVPAGKVSPAFSVTTRSPISSPVAGSTMMSVRVFLFGCSIPIAVPTLPPRFPSLSTTVTPGMSAAALYSAARRSAGTTPVRRAAAMRDAAQYEPARVRSRILWSQPAYRAVSL